MAKQAEFYLTALRNAGQRITEQRQVICDYLANTKQHPTPSQVYADIHTLRPEISRATVYNTLNALQQLGAIVELNFGTEHTHYETDPSPHINLICLQCHQVVDYHSDAAALLTQSPTFQALLEQIGFQPIATKVDILGLCHLCQAEQSAKNA
ncbi:MAG: transcriptional repressor [Caldilineaceae bacterium]|nr:transcriptional repressor [Caldilineaceae bacterium]